MSRVLRRLGQLLIALALVVSVGGHWPLLQTVAWTGMLASNLQRTSIAQAVSNTFDGEHPCAMCKVIKASRTAEKKPDPSSAKSGTKFEPSLAWQPVKLTLERAREWVASSDEAFSLHHEGPPKPRPRASASLACS